MTTDKNAALILRQIRLAVDRALEAKSFSVKERDFCASFLLEKQTPEMKNYLAGIEGSTLDDVVQDALRSEPVRYITKTKALDSANEIVKNDIADFANLPRAERIAAWRAAGGR